MNVERRGNTIQTSLDRTVPGAVLFVGAVVALYAAFGQLTDPFIAHDDFDWLIAPGFDQGFESPWSKASSEGRWLNYPWSFFTVNLTTKAAAFMFIGLACLAAGTVSTIYAGRFSAIAASIMFFSPPGAEVAMWPVTQSSSLIVMVICSLALTKGPNLASKLLALSFGTCISILTYPAYAPLLLILFGASAALKPRGLVLAALTYVCSYAAGILIIFSLNWLFHDHFGLTVAAWRQATPLFPDGDFASNALRYLRFWLVLEPFWPAAVIGSIAYFLCFLKEVRSRQCGAILLFCALIVSMEATISIVNGLDIPTRTAHWLWAAMASPVLFLLNNGKRPLFAYGLTAVLLLVGVGSWAAQFGHRYGTFAYARSLGEELTIAASANAGKFKDIIVFGDTRQNDQMHWLQSNRHLRNYLFKEFRLYTKSCSPEVCPSIARLLKSSPFNAPIQMIDGNLVLVASPTPGDAY